MYIRERVPQCAFEDLSGEELCMINDNSEPGACDACINSHGCRDDLPIEKLRKEFNIKPHVAARLVDSHRKNKPGDKPVAGTIFYLRSLPGGESYQTVLFDRFSKPNKHSYVNPIEAKIEELLNSAKTS